LFPPINPLTTVTTKNMYTGFMSEVGYYLDQADINDVRAKLAAFIDRGYVDVDPVDMFANATIIIVTRTEWVTKEGIEQILGTPVINEEDLEWTNEYAFLEDLQERRDHHLMSMSA